MVIRTEDAQATAWVSVDVGGRDFGGYVAEAKRMVADNMALPAGYTMVWSGRYEYMERAKAKVQLVVPATLALVVLFLYLNFRTVGVTLIVMRAIPFTLGGGVWFLWALDYNGSVAVTIGSIALAGVAAETAVIMLVYLDSAWKEQTAASGGGAGSTRDVWSAASLRIAKSAAHPSLWPRLDHGMNGTALIERPPHQQAVRLLRRTT